MLRRIVLIVSILVAVLVVAAVAAVVLIDPDDYRDEIAERASDRLGREVRLDGPIDLKLLPWLAFEMRQARVGNPPDFGEAPPLAEIGRATASIRVLPLLTGKLEVGAVELEEASLHLVTSRDGRSNLEGLFADVQQPREPEATTDLTGLQTGQIRLSDVVVHLIDLAAGERTEVRIESFTLAPFAPGRPVPLDLAASLSDGDGTEIGRIEFAARLNLAADLTHAALEGMELDFDLPGADASGRAGGTVTADLGASPAGLTLAGLEVAMTVGELELALEGTRDIAVSLGEPIRIDLPGLAVRLDGQALAVSGSARLGEPVTGQLDVTGERLDLTALAAAGGRGEAGGDEAAGDFSALSGLDLSFSLALDELILAEGVQLAEVTARARLAGGQLVLEPMAAQLFGGQFDGRASVDFNRQPPAVSVQPRLTGIRVGRLASLVSSVSPVEGAGDLELDFRFQGLTPAAMLASLDGTGSFVLRDGVVEGVDLRRLVEQELSVANLGELSKAIGGQTPFRELTGRMRAREGVIELPDLNLAAAGYGARGRGSIDFAAGQVDYRVQLDLGEELMSKLPERLRRATGGRIPLAVTGPIGQPIVSVDIAGIARSALSNELGRQLFGDDEPETGDGAPDEASSEGDSGDAGEALLRGLLDRAVRDQGEADEEAETESETGEPPP